MKEIQLTQGKVAQVDDKDFEELNQFKWCAHKNCKTYYAVRRFCVGGKSKITKMHYEILGILPELQTDHIDGDGLNNQKSNLRFVTSRQNNQNRKNITKTSKYPGVCWHKRDKKWQAEIRIKGVIKYLGQFILEKNAFDAYCKAINAIGEKVIDFRK